ncbi:MAG: chitobiase/beta-hexosaminidase C-terminal domain-containing protein, partial [Deltaproteobacteria bacterium]|nr:chitobiase/beta-hexosaminidase C-terminal domain-containing protein [Deltaproteobacteria bacterium]
KVRLRINPQNAGPAPRIYYAEDSLVTEASCLLKDQTLDTKALHVNFLVCDPSHQYETGEVVTWSNKIVLRNKLSEVKGKRMVELFAAPKGDIRYTLDGSEPRDGTTYIGPITIGDKEILLRVFAEADRIEGKTDFRFPAKGKKGVQIDDIKPARLVSRVGRKLDSREKTFEGLKQAAEKSVTFEGIVLTVGQGNHMISVNVGEIELEAIFIQALLTKVLEKFTPTTPVNMTFRKAHFASGHDLNDFTGKLGIELKQEDVEQ